jgi:hypothetical protein
VSASTSGFNPTDIVRASSPDVAASPVSAYRYLNAKRKNLLDSAHQRPLIRLWDENHKYIGTIGNEVSVSCEELMADSGSASVVIRKDNWLSDFIMYDRRAEQDLHITIDPIPTQRSWRTRWGGKVVTVNAKRSSEGLHTIELQCIHNREHLKHVIAQSNPIFGAELQLPKMWVLPANCRTAITVSGIVNLARQFEPVLAIPDNIFNPGAWLGTSASMINPMAWPIQFQWINPFVDQSRTEVFASRWSDMHTTTQGILEDAGCIVRAYTFIAGEDTESPHPELADIGTLLPGALGKYAGEVTHDMFMPKRNCIILAVEDKSGVHGWTGSLADGPLSLISSTADDLITDTLIPEYDLNGDGQTDPLIRRWFAAAPEKPHVIFRDGDLSGIGESERAVHGATAKTVVVGGHSPGWLNDAIRFGVQYGLSELSSLFYFFQGNSGSGQVPGTPGLDALYTDQLSDVFFAYQRFSDPRRMISSGDFGYLEQFEQGGSGGGTAYTISGVLSLRAAQWKTRAYTSYKTTVRNAAPWIYNYDYTLGDRVGFEMANVIYTDQVAGVKYQWDVNSPVKYEISIGTDQSMKDPVLSALKAINGIWNLFGMFAGSSSLF